MKNVTEGSKHKSFSRLQREAINIIDLRLNFYIIAAYVAVETGHNALTHKWLSGALRENATREAFLIK